MISRIQRAVVRLSLIHGPQPRPTVSFFAFAVFIVKTLALTSTVRGAPQLASFNLPVAHGFVTPTRHSSLYRRFSGRVPPLMISASDLSQYGPKGSAARPLDKKRVCASLPAPVPSSVQFSMLTILNKILHSDHCSF